MIWDRSLHALIPRNPILVRDLRYQQRATSFLRGFIESVGVVAVALCFSVAMLFCVVNNLDAWRWLENLDSVQLLAWTFHSIAVLRLLAAGFFVISPDTYLLDSDDLMVTPLSNRQLLIGKWWAALHQVRGWLLALGIVQLGIVVSVLFGLRFYFNWEMTGSVFTIKGLPELPGFTLTRSLFTAASSIGITIVETLCCTALGMAAAVVVRSKLGLVCAISLRFAPVLIFAFFPDYPWAGSDFMRRYLQYTWFSFADGGTGAIIQLAGSLFDRGVLGLCAFSGMLLIYLGLSLVAAWAVMRRTRR